jgi:hypothetical protein
VTQNIDFFHISTVTKARVLNLVIIYGVALCIHGKNELAIDRNPLAHWQSGLSRVKNIYLSITNKLVRCTSLTDPRLITAWHVNLHTLCSTVALNLDGLWSSISILGRRKAPTCTCVSAWFYKIWPPAVVAVDLLLTVCANYLLHATECSTWPLQ